LEGTSLQTATPNASLVRLGSGDDLVGACRQGEVNTVIVIRLDGRGNIQHGELDVFRPMTALPIISASVDRAAYDRILGHLFAMAVAEDQHRRREFGWMLRNRGRGEGLGLGIVRRGIGSAFGGLPASSKTHVTVALQLNHQRLGPGLLRRIDKSAPEVWPLPSPDASIETEVHFVEPGYAGDWMWAPTSGNCFRRDALQLFLNNEHLAPLRTGTDAYIIRGVNVVTGNVVIDRPLGVYRLHGMNEFSKHPHLNGVVNYERNSPSDPNQLGRKMIIDHLIANARLFLRKMPSPWRYMKALKAMDDEWPRILSTVPGCRSYLAGKLVTEARALAPALGIFYFIVLLVRLKAAPHVILKACLKRTTEKRS